MAESGVFRYLPFKNEYKNRQQDILLPIMSQTNYMYVLMLSVFSTLIQTRFVSLAPRRCMAHIPRHYPPCARWHIRRLRQSSALPRLEKGCGVRWIECSGRHILGRWFCRQPVCDPPLKPFWHRGTASGYNLSLIHI